VVAAILLAAGGTWVLVNYVSEADNRAVEGQEQVPVLVVDVAIPQGTPVTEVAGSVSTSMVPEAVLIPGALDSLQKVAGKVTAVDLLPGEQVVDARFVDPEDLPKETRSVEVPAGRLELTVALSPERSVGGSLVPGDLVAVISSFDPFTLDAVEPENEEDLNSFLNNEDQTETITLKTPNSTGISVHKALVTRVQVAQAREEGSATQSQDVAPQGTLLVSLAVHSVDLEQIVFTAEYGSLWLAREHADTVEEDPVLIITRANVYR
jgi:pilus assembly protein CpaB